ncbi:protein phosphatase 2C domain-containing protein [Streptomyces sp. NBC_00435]|uniref:hypothetical protein n=1 Tax=Streptomyces sp. NBC_00435 TaxID=2903649 RepID=UPI002E20E65B
MSQQGAGADDWWQKLYEDPDTGPDPDPRDTLDHRFRSAAVLVAPPPFPGPRHEEADHGLPDCLPDPLTDAPAGPSAGPAGAERGQEPRAGVPGPRPEPMVERRAGRAGEQAAEAAGSPAVPEAGPGGGDGYAALPPPRDPREGGQTWYALGDVAVPPALPADGPEELPDWYWGPRGDTPTATPPAQRAPAGAEPDPGSGPRPGAGRPGPEEATPTGSAAVPGPDSGPDAGSDLDPGLEPGPGSAQPSGSGLGSGSGPSPGSAADLTGAPGPGSTRGPGFDAGSRPDAGHGPGFDLGSSPAPASGWDSGPGPGFGTGQGPGPGPGAGAGHGSGLGSGVGPDQGVGSGPGAPGGTDAVPAGQGAGPDGSGSVPETYRSGAEAYGSGPGAAVYGTGSDGGADADAYGDGPGAEGYGPGAGGGGFGVPRPAVAHLGDRPPTYAAEPVALPAADPAGLAALTPDTVLEGAQYGGYTLRAASVRGDSARFRGEPRRDFLLIARFGTGPDALVLAVLAGGDRAAPGAADAAAELCRSVAGAVGRSQERLSDDIRAGRREALRSGLQRLTDRGYGRLRTRAAELGVPAEAYTAGLRGLLLPVDPGCRTRVCFGAGAGGLFRLRGGQWSDLEETPPPGSSRAGSGLLGPGDPERGAPPGAAPMWADPRGSVPGTVPAGAAPAGAAPWGQAPAGADCATAARAETATGGSGAGAGFRFRASVARAGDVLLLCSGGLAEPMREEQPLSAELGVRWSDEPAPGLAAFLADTQLRLKGYADDRTAAAVWEA